MSVFLQTFLTDFFRNVHSLHKDNWDHLRFGHDHPRKKTFMVETAVQRMETLMRNFSAYEWAFENLADDYSKALLVKLLEFAVLDHHHVRLPLSNAQYWADFASVDQNYRRAVRAVPDEKYEINQYFDPETDISVFTTTPGFLTQFIHKQYFLNRAPFTRPACGDICIDGGSCWGDVALRLMQSAAPEGQVHAFEFVRGNLEMLQRNLELNPQLARQITVDQRALWHETGCQLSFDDRGSSTSLTQPVSQNTAQSIGTVTIDDYVREKNLPKIDFIKMDIEGAEIPALQGAAGVIRSFRPKLAVCVYHKLDDFYTIPRLIREIHPGYRFYLDHYTIHREETVLYAQV